MIFVVYKLDGKKKASFWTGSGWSRNRDLRRVYRSESNATGVAEQYDGNVIRATSMKTLNKIETGDFSEFYENIRNQAADDHEIFTIVDIKNMNDVKNLKVVPHVQNLIGAGWMFGNKALHKALDEKIEKLKNSENQETKRLKIAQ